MIDTIKLLIDNEETFLNDFIAMANDAEDKYELADWLKSWFEDALEYEKIEVVAKDIHRDNRKSYIHVFRSILAAAIQNISGEEWLDLARHYMTKAAEARR